MRGSVSVHGSCSGVSVVRRSGRAVEGVEKHVHVLLGQNARICPAGPFVSRPGPGLVLHGVARRYGPTKLCARLRQPATHAADATAVAVAHRRRRRLQQTNELTSRHGTLDSHPHSRCSAKRSTVAVKGVCKTLFPGTGSLKFRKMVMMIITMMISKVSAPRLRLDDGGYRWNPPLRFETASLCSNKSRRSHCIANTCCCM